MVHKTNTTTRLPHSTRAGVPRFGFAKAAVQQLFAHAVNRLQQTPDDEWRGAAVPEAGSKEHAEHAQLGGQAAKAAKICPGQRHKEIILQPGRKRDVPAAPEARKVGGVKRGLKVFRQVQPQHKAGGTGNLGIAGKAEIQIKSVHHRGQNQHGGAVIRIVGKTVSTTMFSTSATAMYLNSPSAYSRKARTVRAASKRCSALNCGSSAPARQMGPWVTVAKS